MSKLGSLGSLSGNILGSPMGDVTDLVSGLVGSVVGGKYGSVTNPVPAVPAACWSKTNFGACQQWAIASPRTDCANLGKAGNWPQSEIDKCIEDKYRYRMNVNCIGTCASGTVTYPGMPATAAAPAALSTLDLQKALNAILKPAGYVALTEDGQLGAKTCGAAKQFMTDKVPSTCTSFTAPVKAGSSSTVAYVAPVTVKPVTTTSTTTTLTTASMFASAKWLIGGSIAIAVGLVGVAVAQKKGWIKPPAGAKPAPRK
jgi:hypothetical protein